MAITKPKPSGPLYIEKYGWRWPATMKPLEIELACIRHGGRFTHTHAGVEYIIGEGLYEHMVRVEKMLWPGQSWHRWSELFYRTVIENQVTITMGCASSGKSCGMSKYALIRYFADPHNTCVLVSSTSRDKLEGAIYGQIKEHWKAALKRFPWLPGNPVEYKQMILTGRLVKQRDEDERDPETLVRTWNKGIIGKPCFTGEKYVGLGVFAGLKQKNMIFIGDELQFMASTFLDCLVNLRSNVAGEHAPSEEEKQQTFWLGNQRWFGLKVIASGNPNHDPESQLGIAAEPLEGWASVENNEKTAVWPVRIDGGVCLNFIGTDSPNYDQERDIYPILGRKHEAQIISQYGKDSPQYESQVKGRMKMGLAASRVITREVCRNGKAQDKVTWAGGERTKVHFVDPAYGGGDRCISIWGEFGEAIDGTQILRFTAPKLIRINLKDGRTPEDQIAAWVKRELEDHNIPVLNSGYDSTGKGTIGNAYAKVFGEKSPNAVSSGEKPTRRPVRFDLFVDDLGVKRLKRCDEHYSKFITEEWFSVREAIDAGQIREMTDDVIAEGCSRVYKWVSGDRIEIEPKDKMRERTGKSPDLFDAAAGLVEMARRSGFQIKRLGGAAPKDESPDWFTDKREAFQTVLKSKMLQRAA